MKRAEHEPDDMVAFLSGSRRISLALPGLKVEYAWLPPFAGAAVTRPNRIEVVFSAHSGVAITQGQQTYDIAVEPGAMYVVGPEATTLLRVANYSDTLEMYPDPLLLNAAADWENIRYFELQPTLRNQRSVAFRRDAVVLGALPMRCGAPAWASWPCLTSRAALWAIFLPGECCRSSMTCRLHRPDSGFHD